jgi:probable RNA-binding protein EIF1AD
MPKPKRHLHATISSTLSPPSTLAPTETIAHISKAAGNNLYTAQLPNGDEVLVELEARFRSTIWIKRGTYVVVDTGALAERENKLGGVIVNVVRDERGWRKMGYWYVLSGWDWFGGRKVRVC